MAGEPIAVAELTEAERQRLRSEHPELSRAEAGLVIFARRPFLDAIRRMAQSLAWETARSAVVLNALAEDPAAGVLPESRVLQLQRQAEARAQFLQEFQTMTSQQVARQAGSTARNTAALANRWKAARKIFAVPVGRAERYPAFQFGDDGKPLPGVAPVLHVFEDNSPWAIALWFASPCGWLDDVRPADIIATQPEAVLEAASRTVEPLGF